NSAPGNALNLGAVSAALAAQVNPAGFAVSTSDTATAILFGFEHLAGSAFAGLYNNNGGTLGAGVRLGGFLMGGSSNSATLQNSALIAAWTDSAWSHGSSYGTYITFETTNNSSTTRVERM